MSFLKDVGNQFIKQMNTYANAGENTPRSLYTPDPNNPDQVADVGLLGEFANKIDHSAQRSYVESGYISNIRPRSFEALLQEPDMTIIIKKRMFSSLVDNYRIDMMEQAERNFIKASKRLFQNKCQVVATYERLAKIEKVIQNRGIADDFFTPLLISGIETLEAFGVNIVDQKTKRTIETVRKMQAFSDPGNLTTWFVSPDMPYDLGEGTGTFSLTMAASCNTTSSVQFGAGKCNITIEDPYHLMSISELDIDRAIADIYNRKQSSSLFQFSESELSKQNNDMRAQLNKARLLRGAAPIVWRVNDNAIISAKVRAFIDEEGRELIFSFDPGVMGIGAKVNLDPSATEGENGLIRSEEILFDRITKNIYLIINLQRQKEEEIDDVINQDNQGEIDYLRSKMRLHYVNKNMIQIMDSVHIFMTSKTMVDNKIIGFDSRSIVDPGNNILSMLNSSIENLEQSFNNIGGFFGGGSKYSYTDVEKEAIVGADFPTWLWVAIRNDFTRQAAGTHVFGGLVISVNESYNSGKYELSVSCADNTEYFKMGQINIKPAVDVPERSIFDPLTPFDLEFDGATGFLVNDHPKLLSENERLLFSGIAKFKNGSRFIGSPMTEFLYLLGDTNIKAANGVNQTQRVFFDPDGFVYRWKSGIGTFTYNSSRHPNNAFRKSASPLLTKNPFAGQDVMNVLSLLISGVPYNYNTFITSSVKNSNLSFLENKDGLSNTEMARSFFRSFISDLQIDNTLWGNFVPFKRLVMDDAALRFSISGQFSYQQNSAELDRLLSERAKLYDTLSMADAVFAGNPNIYGLSLNGEMNKDNMPQTSLTNQDDRGLVAAASTSLFELDTKINSLQNQVYKTIEDGSMQVFGDDISYSPDLDGLGNQVGEEEKEQTRALMRRKMKLLTQRRLWKVSANDDQNLLIIDDQYDKDYDIQAFERALADKMSLLKSDYTDIATQISSVAKILGLEVFANSQGHVEIKPPGYNKVPSSVFYKMISDGRKIYPKTLETLFIDQADGLIDRLCIVEDQIRLRTLVMGLTDDFEAQKFLSGANFGDASFSFKFITNERGQFGVKPSTIRALVAQDSASQREENEFKALKETTGKIAEQIRNRALFDTSSQVSAVFDSTRFMPADDVIKTAFDRVSTRIHNTTGQPVPTIKDLVGERINQGLGSVNSQTSILKLTKEISSYVSERQSVLKLLKNSLKNLEQASLIDNDPTTRRNAIFPSFQGKKEAPSVIQHLIENEDEDDLGPGSGGRYIIKDNQIISFSISENKPDFTTIEVNGLVGEGFVPPVGEIGFNGNMQSSAIAVDYDLWRMYGFKVGSNVSAPYISDADAQAAPLANWLLTEQRRKLISGNMQIAGNEFMQPGEVIYMEDRDLLFYVESVSHNFNFGSSFTTNLTLTYGHNPGEYFPTMLDIIGKGLYSKRNQANKIRNARHGYSNGDQHLGIIVIDNNSGINSIVVGKYGDQNRATLTQVILALKGSQASTDDEAFVEIRYYSNPEKGFPEDQNIKNKAELIKTWLKNPSRKTFGIDGLAEGDSLKFPPGTNSFSDMTSSGLNKLLGKSKEVPDSGISEGLKIDDIDRLVSIRNITSIEAQGPSGRAWLAARESSGEAIDTLGTYNDITQGSMDGPAPWASLSDTMNSSLQSVATVEEKVLYKTVLDVWVSFKPKAQ